METLGCETLKIEHQYGDLSQQDELKRQLLSKVKCCVRLYIVECTDLTSKDIGSDSDPYVKIKLGDTVINERKFYQEDEPNPRICKRFDFNANFPGCPMLHVQVFDHDILFPDELIGETKIDLEDRFFQHEWQSIKNKPIEIRTLKHSSSEASQGFMKMWVEIAPADQIDNIPCWDISDKPPFQM